MWIPDQLARCCERLTLAEIDRTTVITISGRSPFQYPGQTNFAIQAGFQALVAGQVVNGPAAQVDQITTQRSEQFQKLPLAVHGENAGKSVANGPVKSRVCLIEKSTGGRRPLAHEEHPDTGRAIASSQTFPGLRGVFLILLVHAQQTDRGRFMSD